MTYKKAVSVLNLLQSNQSVLKERQMNKKFNPELNITETNSYLNKLGITLDELDSLKIIHIAGTKGKGSTCAFTESILRSFGFKTGFYSSPHLISVCERIRISGKPLSEKCFTDHFWQVYNTLNENRHHEKDMPNYFTFLTVMAFHVFLKSEVNVAIIEVGIGGRFDSTNVIRKPIVVGITLLDLDHVTLLGNSLEDIAYQKAGIMKSSVPAVTVVQEHNALEVLKHEAIITNCPLYLCEEQTNLNNIKLGIPGSVQQMNASLALQIVYLWLKQYDLKTCKSYEFSVLPPVKLEHKFINGLQNCSWLGRFQIIERNNFILFMDGAHTQKSMEKCCNWFLKESTAFLNRRCEPAFNILIFYCMPTRNASNLLQVLSKINFNLAIFCPPFFPNDSPDTIYMSLEYDEMYKTSLQHKKIWQELSNSLIWTSVSVVETFSLIHSFKNQSQEISKMHILITGSLHLVGASLHYFQIT